MNAITIRNLSDEASRMLEALAARNGTTAEAEHILNDALIPASIPTQEKSGKDLVDALQKLGRKFGGLEDVDFSRDQTPARDVSFE